MLLSKYDSRTLSKIDSRTLDYITLRVLRKDSKTISDAH